MSRKGTIGRLYDEKDSILIQTAESFQVREKRLGGCRSNLKKQRKDIAEDSVNFIKEESVMNDCNCNNIL